VAVVGVAIIAGGIVLLPLPGPGWVIIFLGLGVLASEFTWAKRLLAFARKQVAAWTDWIKRQSRVVRGLVALSCVVLIAALVLAYVAWQGVPSWIPVIG